AEHRVECRALARAVGPDNAQDPPFLDAQIDSVEGDGVAIGLAQAACFEGGHGFSALPMWRSPAAPRTRTQQVLRVQAEALDRVVNLRPLLREESLPFALQEQLARSRVDEHAEPAP